MVLQLPISLALWLVPASRVGGLFFPLTLLTFFCAARVCTAQERAVFKEVGAVCLAFSPDGKRLAAAYPAFGNGQVKVLDVATGKAVVTLSDFEKGPWGVAFSPDGKILAVAAGGEPACLYDSANWKLRDRLPVPRRPKQVQSSVFVAISPDGKTVASVFDSGGINLWDAITGTYLSVLDWPGPLSRERKRPSASAKVVAFSPDGKTLAGAGPGGVILWDVATRKPRVILEGPDRGATSVAYSRDGRQLVAVAAYMRGRNVFVWDVASGRLVKNVDIDDKYGEAHVALFSDDGKILVVAGRATIPNSPEDAKREPPRIVLSVGRIRLWDLAQESDRAVWKLAAPTVEHLALSPDGRTLAASCQDGSVRLFGMPSEQAKQK